MTVKELIEILNDFHEDALIGYGDGTPFEKADILYDPDYHYVSIGF